MSGFLIIKAGIFTLIQDSGRFSYSHLGVCNSGVMDEYAAFMAHSLLKNSINTNILEIAFGNIELLAKDDTTISVCGANCEFFINNIEKKLWKTHKVYKNNTIKIGKIFKGQRVYVAVKGGFIIKKELDSNSTTIKENLGGIDANKLKNGDFLPYKKINTNLIQALKTKYIPLYNEDILELRILFSYQENYFNKDILLNNIYTITNDFNRMACKLSGEKIKSNKNEIISEGISFGAVQITTSGDLIILLKERQTIGGYPKIGSIFSVDCFKLSQAKANQKIKFITINIKQAQEKLKTFYKLF